MANVETWGKYLTPYGIQQTQFSVVWSSMGESGNIVTDSYYNLEVWQDDEGPEGTLIFSSYRIPLNDRSRTFTNLIPGTHYLIKLYANRQKDRAIDRHWVKTLDPSNPVPGTPTLSLSLRNDRDVYISGTIRSDTTHLEVYVDDVRRWTLYVATSSTYGVTYYGNYNTRYKIHVIPKNSWHTGSTVTRYITTNPEPPPDPPPAPSGFNIYNQGETWASFAWNTTARAEKYAMEIFQGNTLIKYDYSIYNTVKTFDGLSPGVQYMAKLYGWNTGGNGTPVSFYFTLGYSRPPNFSWVVTKARGRSYNLVNSQYTNLVTYDEFIAFRQRVNDFRRYKKLDTYTFTNIGRNSVLTATLYNQLNTAIGAMSPPTSTPGARSSGASDLPGLLNGLVTSLNSIK
ncbi:fibronectin type III domain-containing protein [Bhargavaea ginsengi]|uniref:fibronectin type III domain-containing protein n=1 Tax=Bhargavaea ginsengi TaxID=426757 RepID=UPI003C718F91